MNETFPLAREARLIVKELAEEVLVYDLDTDQAHCLNQTAALVWRNCNGQRTVAQLAKSIEQATGSPVPEEMIWLALDQLAQFKLLNGRISKPDRLAGMSRRRLIRSLGLGTAVSIPVIASIIVPTPAMAASCGSLTGRDNGCPCMFDSDCASGCCRNGECKPGSGNCE